MKKNYSKRELLSLVDGHKRTLIYAIILVIIATAISTTMPLIFRELIDKAIPSKDFNQILTIASLYFLAISISSVCYLLQQLIVGTMGIKIVNKLKIKIFDHLLKLPISYFDKNGAGKLISRVDSDSTQLFSLFSSVTLEMIGSFLNIGIAIFVMFTINVKYATYVVITIPIFLLLSLAVFGRLKTKYKEDRRLYAKISSFLGEQLKAIPLLKRLGSLPWSIQKFNKINYEKVKYGHSIYLIEYSAYFLLRIIPEFTIAWLIFNGAHDIKANLVTVGTVWMFIDYLRMALEPLYRISEQIGQIQRGFSSADRIFDILTNTKGIEPTHIQDHQIFAFKNSIRFENVSFSYTEDKPVLKNLSFEIKKGEIVAFVAPTGAGKTTIFSLLAKFYMPTNGKIFIDGVELKELNTIVWRQALGLVWQDIKLFPGNVIDNLKVLRTDISDESVLNAINILGINDIIDKFPNKLNTNLLENGNNISQGEKQLLSFARTMVFNPEIILLDEATSAIDPKTEQMIQEALEKIIEGKTALIIAHRLSTIKKAHKIFVLNEGTIAEFGTHEELLAKQSIYASLYHSQMNKTVGKQ